MSSNAKQDSEKYQKIIACHAARAALLVFVVLAALFAMAETASAYTPPYKVVVFTDKQVYLDYAYLWTQPPTIDTTRGTDTYGSFSQQPNLFVVLLDSDGNIVKGIPASNISAALRDVERWNHSGPGLANYPFYTVISTGGTYYNYVAFPAFTDNDVDGIFNSSNTNVVRTLSLATKPPLTDHLNISINVTLKYNGTTYKTNVSVIFGNMGCRHDKTIGTAHGAGQHDGVVCTVCHWGYQYALGTHGPNNTILYDDPERLRGISRGESDSADWDYKLGTNTLSLRNQTTWDNSNASFCVLCHGGSTTTTTYDYLIGSVLAITTGAASGDQNGDGIPDNKRPSCSWYQGPRNGTGGYPVCHGTQAGSNGTTKITGSQLFNVDWKGWSQTPGQSKSHNHSSTTKGVPCELCHAGGGAPGTGTGGLHQVAGLPNRSTDYTNINDQCWSCHNITDGWLNITSNGGTAKNHSKTKQCSNCHTENNKLDSHIVPVGAYGGKWCMDCHNLTGKSPIDMKVDPAIANISNKNYTHYDLNHNSDAANSSRICWGCHTNNSLVRNGRVNATNLSVDEHPGGYDAPRNCTSCHNNTNASINFGAPQTYRHTWYAPDMRTTAVTYCPDCHAKDEEVNAWNEEVYPPKTDNESASHYGENRTSFFLPLEGKREYCGYCHQNEATVMGPFKNPDNKVRGDHASQISTPGCGNATCHEEGRMHDDTIVVPKFTEANISSTCQNPACHQQNNYNFHNSTLTCWDCHMGNVSNTTGTWIHPIQFIQYNGNFTGAALTSATCYDCHKSTNTDITIKNLSGKTSPKVYGQAHSNDPGNGTKWGDYWKYTPTTYEFVDYRIIGNGTIDPAHPFENIKVPSNDYMQLNETKRGSGDGITVPFNMKERQINGPPVPNWTSATSASGSSGSMVTASQDATKGNPAGSLKASLKTGSKAGTYNGYVWWNYSFYYKPNTTYGFAYTNASVDYNITVGSANAQNVYLNLVKPSGTVVTLASASSSTNTGWVSMSNNSFASALNEDGSVTPYNIQLYTVLLGTTASRTQTINYDNILLKIQEKVWNRYEIELITTDIPVNGSSKLGMSYQAHMENTSLSIYNKTSGAFDMLDTLDKGVFYDYVIDINSTHHINSTDGKTGNVSVKFVDTDQSEMDAVTDVFHIRYLYVYTDRGLQYPCEQCHSPNKHYVYPAIGSPDTFKGSNKYNSTNLSNSTWCVQCHWDKASNYSDMIREFNVTRKPPENIPPEITGNKTYGNFTKSKDDKTAYVNHTGPSYSDMNDSGCFLCHGKSGDTTSSQFVHNVQVGAGGNRKCVTCHNTSASNTQYKKVDVDALRKGMHANLKNASANVSNASNPIELACWACHGDGLFNNSEDHHPSIKTCDKCHTNTTGKLNYSSATRVYEHIPQGLITPEANITANSVASWSCADCHNNSINTTALVNDNDPINARTGHYGLNRTGGKLMYDYSAPPKGNSEDCNYCHKGNNNNMTKWGVNTSTTKNLNNKASHSGYTNNDCGGCHNSNLTNTFTFHVEEMNEGAGGASNPNCKSCHNISDTNQQRGHVDYPAFNISIHGGINTTAGADENEPCWACHGNGNSEGHNTTGDAFGKGNYVNPYVCADCHVSTGVRYVWATGKGALNVSEHFTNGTDIKASYNATVTFSCLKCHQDIGEMLLYNNDTDYNKTTAWTSGGDNYNGTIGGNNSPYHYGRKRTDIRSGANTSCAYCHQNSSTAFASVMQNPSVNKSIFEHTDNGTKNVTGRACADAGCHNTGFIHNSTLTKPVVSNWTQGKYDYCAPCHRESGISTKKVRGHNTSNISTPGMDCGYCHNASSQGQASGALRIHSTRLANKSTANSTCETCHRDVTYVPAGRIIKTHYPNATTEKGNTSESGRTCELCHSISVANKLHQSTVKKPNYDCQSCHRNGYKTSPYNATTAKASINSFLHDNTTHAPTNQSGCERCHNTTNRQEIFHFTDYANGTSVAPGWASWTNGTQANCIDCHRNKTNQAPFYALFSSSPTHTSATLDGCYNCHTDVSTHDSNPKALHYVVQAPGNANCTLCHDLAGEASKKIDVAAMNKSDSIHLNLNKDATVVKASPFYAGDSKRCWACHGNGTEPNSHPANFKNAYKCADCHVPSGGRNTNYTPNNTILNVTEHYRGGSDIKTAAATYCTDCHNKTEMLKSNSDTALSVTNPANDSVSHYGMKRSDIRPGTSANCSYCHQNSSTAFENVMLGSLNKSIYEHTENGTRNTTGRSCTNSSCHASGYIHNSTLTKPAVQNWTANSKDYCAPCHKAGDGNATKYVYAHNTSNISVVSMDCGYCHNASSQGATSNGALRIHSIQLTNTSATNSTCAACHRDSKYVGASRVINTHYPGAPAGKANTYLSAWDCEECHGWAYGAKMHNQGLIKKPNYDCNSCHNASGASQYKANATPFVNVTRHDNTSHNGANINCNSCHNNTNRLEPFHFTQWSNGTVEAPGWSGWVNGTRANCTVCHITYANQAPFFAEPGTYPNWHKGNYGSTLNDCYQCHSNLTVLNASDIRVPVEMHNVTRAIDWGNCNACHANKYGGAPKVDNASLSAANSMHATIDGATASNINPSCKACHGGNVSIHKNSSVNSCTYCHIAGKTKYGAKNVSEHILNGSYANTTVNTSRYQQVFCDLCHNNSLAGFNDDTQGSSNATAAHYGQNRSASKLMGGTTNSTDCMFCHKNGSNMAKWGVLSTSNANINNRGDHNVYSANNQCYECHVDSKGIPVTFHAEELNQGTGSNPNCINCHNIGSSNKNIDFTATNASNNIHKNLNSGANAAGYDSANKPCWACHGNGTATAHINTTYKAPKLCESCHINTSAPYGAPQVKEHFRNGSEIKATNATNNTRSCLACHQNISEMLLSNNDPDAGSFDAEGDGVNGTNISAYHYGKKRADLRSGANTSCLYCHQNLSSVFPLTDTNRSIYEHTSSTANITNATLTCTSNKCHATGLIHDANLTKPAVQVWTPGSKDYCAPCHRPGNSNATRYVYSHNTTATPIGDDCGYCHNSSSQGINGSIVKLHSSTLTNSTSPVIYSGCQGCHNATTTYVGAAKQIVSHMPNASQYRGNTSTSDYDCNSCHNMSGKPSMHSIGMNRSNGTCDTCHFNRISPYKSTKKVIASNDYNHTYAGVKTCNISQCHNASGAALGFHLDKYAAGIVADPERVNSVWSDRNDTGNGFTDTLYVDCIDCHRQHNNTYPFTNSVGYEANITGENKKAHTATDSIDSCYNCHTNRSGSHDRYMVHNVTIEPLEGGPACIKCHNLSAPAGQGFPTNRVNHTILNNSVHRNLTNYTAWNDSKKPNTILLDSACWTCHVTDIANVPSNSHPDRGGPSAERAFQCEECHTSGGNISYFNPQVYENATKIYKHYAGLAFSNKLVFNSSKECFECHRNSLFSIDNILYTNNYKYKNEANVSHYSDRNGLPVTNETKSGCNLCHSGGLKDYGNAREMPSNHSRMGGSPTPCQYSCHNSDTSVNITLHESRMGIYLGVGGCFGSSPCHVQTSTGTLRKR